MHYTSMSLSDIMNLPVAMLAAPQCWLFVWTVSSHLPGALDVIDAWGFTYSSVGFTWIKTRKCHDGSLMLSDSDLRAGLGFTTRKGSELCLLARRGNPRRRAKDVREVILASPRQHSRKPDEAYARVQRYCAGPYLDLFARETHDGWDAWGDEVGKFDQRHEAAE
jgi:N6-adenosine-specific RNA methylase IME4